MKINFLKVKKNYLRGNFKFSSNFYWKVIVVIFFLLIIGSFIFIFSIFREIGKQEDCVVSKSIEKLSDKEKKKIQDALIYFAEREKKSSEILNSGTSVVDPAL
jgi:hypothetical protein